ncbi:cytochrome b/b6 domain-containing protein [Sphingomonas arenae]|uniref:cytochrome b/b6 domain-containing protein n=1 Tax=Sphingomonas arenae TaxID=2812555 RepID=UPI00196780FF|nr:cytochrome b/b6 domain-containing protein [Sphingomonas arenae]
MTDSASKTEVQVADTALAVPVWDWPVRLVHWSLVVLIVFSWWSAENDAIAWHLWSGYAVLFLLLFRITWGFLGSSTARFSSFVRGPGTLLHYLREPGSWRAVGHTPLGALSVIALLSLVLVQVGLGLLLSDEDGIISAPLNRFVSFDTAEAAHDLHEALFNVLLALVALHVAAIIFYRLRGKRLVGAMIRGTAALPAGTEGMVPADAGRLVISVAIAGALTLWIVAGLPPLSP